MKVLRCECENEEDFSELTTVDFIVSPEGERQEKVSETTGFFCTNCGQQVYMGD